MKHNASLQIASMLIKQAGRGDMAFKFLKQVSENPDLAARTGWAIGPLEEGLIDKPWTVEEQFAKTPDKLPLHNLWAAGLRMGRAALRPRSYEQATQKFKADQNFGRAGAHYIAHLFGGTLNEDSYE